MNKSDKEILIGVGALLAIGSGIWYLSKKKKERQQNLDITVGQKPNINFKPIQIGEKSYRAKVIQRYINTACRISVELTGVFDEITQEISKKCAGFPREGVIDEDSYNRAFRTLEVAGLLPEKE